MKNITPHLGAFVLTVAAVLAGNFIWQKLNKPKAAAPATQPAK